jgi:hypothetical protein
MAPLSRQDPPASSDDNFIELVQEHERSWGKDSYPGRPTLAELLNTPVVAWWMPVSGKGGKGEDRRTASVYQDLDELNKYAARLLLHSRNDPPDRRLVAVYINQKKAVIRGVNIQIISRDTD